MKFEAIQNGEIIFVTEQISCIPPKRQIEIMTKAGYKFKIDGKIITKKRIEEILKEHNN